MKIKRLVLLLLILGLIILLFSAENLKRSGRKVELAKVIEVIDGDTIRIENGKRVRLIGIDAPEKGEKCYREAKEFLKKLVLGKIVRLEADKLDKDIYGRLLRYVYLNDTFVNLILLRKGYAHSFIKLPNTKYSKIFQEAERYARKFKEGCLWKGG